jgi:hypothetical protein
MSYVRAAQEGLGMAIVCGGYLLAQVSKENSVNTQWVIGGLMDELPEEGFAPQALRYVLGKRGCHFGSKDKQTWDWLGSKVPTLKAWEGSRLKTVGLEALSTYKRVVDWSLGPVEDTVRSFE